MTTDIEGMSAAFMRAAGGLPRLFSLADGTVEILTLLSALQEGAADDEPELVARLQEVETFLAEKLEACGVVVRDLESLASVRKAEAKRLRDQADRLEAAADRLRLRVRDHMLAVGDTKVVTPRFTVALVTNPPKVEVLEELLVPASFLRHIPERWEVNKQAIAAHYKATGEIPEGVNVTREQRVDFR